MNGLLPRTLSVLLVDDDPGDVLMIEEALQTTARPHDIHVANDGQAAMDYLREIGAAGGPLPDVILLDLNMPRMDGRQVLALVKQDELLRSIPVVVLTTSNAPSDVLSSYQLHANAYVTKPLSLDELTRVVQQIDDFFGQIVSLPHQ